MFEHHAGLKNWAGELRKLITTNIDLHSVCTKKSELNSRIPTSLHRPILTSHVFSYCVKRNLHKNRLIKLFTRARWSQFNTNHGFFRLVEALLQIPLCFFSRSIFMAYRYQRCHCLAALPAKMSVFNSHMQGSNTVISHFK